MAVKSFKVFTGLIGLSPVFHEIFYNVDERLHPVHRNRVQKNILKPYNFQKVKFHLHRKRSKDYEGTGKNYKD